MELLRVLASYLSREERVKLARDDCLREITLFFQHSYKTATGTMTKDEKGLTELGFFDKGFRNNDDKIPPCILVSLSAISQSSIPRDYVSWFKDPNDTPYDIKLVDGRKLPIYGAFEAKWKIEDKDCRNREIFPKGNTMNSLFLVISEDAPHKFLISYNIMLEEGLLESWSLCQMVQGVGGYRPAQPQVCDNPNRRAAHQAIKAAEREYQDNKNKSAPKNTSQFTPKPRKN